MDVTKKWDLNSDRGRLTENKSKREREGERAKERAAGSAKLVAWMADNMSTPSSTSVLFDVVRDSGHRWRPVRGFKQTVSLFGAPSVDKQKETLGKKGIKCPPALKNTAKEAQGSYKGRGWGAGVSGALKKTKTWCKCCCIVFEVERLKTKKKTINKNNSKSSSCCCRIGRISSGVPHLPFSGCASIGQRKVL